MLYISQVKGFSITQVQVFRIRKRKRKRKEKTLSLPEPIQPFKILCLIYKLKNVIREKIPEWHCNMSLYCLGQYSPVVCITQMTKWCHASI